ncbi:unnamed protein product, partial [Mesorhabditis spiculigera]
MAVRLGRDCTDKVIINGVDLVNQDELSNNQLRELNRYIEENAHLLKIMDRPPEEPRDRFTKSPTPSRYGTIRNRIGYPVDVEDGYQTLSQKFGLPNRDKEVDYERTETYHRAPKLDFDMDQWNRTYGKQSDLNLSIENLHVGAPPGGWEALSSGRPSPYSTLDRKGSIRRSVGPSEKRVTIDPNYRASSVDRPSARAAQSYGQGGDQAQSRQVHSAYTTQSLNRNGQNNFNSSATPFDPNRVAREGITGRDASAYSSVVSGLNEPPVTRTASSYRTSTQGSGALPPRPTSRTSTIDNRSSGAYDQRHSGAYEQRHSGIYDRVHEPSPGYNTMRSTTSHTSGPTTGYGSGYSTTKTIHTTAPSKAREAIDPDQIFNPRNESNIFTGMHYEKGPKDVTTISSTVHLTPGEDPQKRIDEIYRSMQSLH